MFKGDLIDWLTVCGLGIPTMIVSEAKNPVEVQSTSLDMLTIPVWHWKPRESLESHLSSVCVGIQVELVLIAVKGCHSNRADELVSKNDGKQAKKQSFLPQCSFL